MNYDPTERRPTIEEIINALNTQDRVELPHLQFPHYEEQGGSYDTTLYFQSREKSIDAFDNNRAESDRQWMLAVLVDILKGVDPRILHTLTYTDIPTDKWRLADHLNTVLIETKNANLRITKDSTIDYGWMLDLNPNDHYSGSTIEILHLNAQYVIFFEYASMD